jgi:acyl carrier protein
MQTSDADTAHTSADGETVKRIIEVLGRIVIDDDVQITEATRLFDDLGLDSTNIMEMLVELESELGVEFDTEALDHAYFETVGSLAGFVSSLLAK